MIKERTVGEFIESCRPLLDAMDPESRALGFVVMGLCVHWLREARRRLDCSCPTCVDFVQSDFDQVVGFVGQFSVVLHTADTWAHLGKLVPEVAQLAADISALYHGMPADGKAVH